MEEKLPISAPTLFLVVPCYNEQDVFAYNGSNIQRNH